MIHPTRTNLLLLRAKAKAVAGSITILKARHQALIQEFLAVSRPFLKSRQTIGREYRQALDGLALSLGHEGRQGIESLAAMEGRGLGVTVEPRNLMGVRYKEVASPEAVRRPADERGYDIRQTTPHLEETIDRFERIAEAMLELAAYESKLKRLGEEIRRVERTTRVLEERVAPRIAESMKGIEQYLGEREREEYFRLKRFKSGRHS